MSAESTTAAPETARDTATPGTRSLDVYRLLGRSGLRVSPMALGTMTFGTEWGLGEDDAEARRVFDTYVDRGGNFIDTANNYNDGTSERLIGQFAHERRDQLVIATKYTGWTRRDDPNSGGNHRKSMIASVESSLRRLDTDYIDLLYLHLWDGTTPVDEILRGLDDLVRSGKVLYVGISDTPAWQVSRMQTITELRGWTPLIALQIEYSLVARTGERDLIPMAHQMGLGVILWSPLAKGVLTGKYNRAQPAATDSARERRRRAVEAGLLSDRGLAIADVVCDVAAETGHTASQVALAWTLLQPGVTAPIIGARTRAQLEENLSALEVILTVDQQAALEQASAIELGFPHDLLRLPRTRGHAFGGTRVEGYTEPAAPPRRWAGPDSQAAAQHGAGWGAAPLSTQEERCSGRSSPT